MPNYDLDSDNLDWEEIKRRDDVIKLNTYTFIPVIHALNSKKYLILWVHEEHVLEIHPSENEEIKYATLEDYNYLMLNPDFPENHYKLFEVHPDREEFLELIYEPEDYGLELKIIYK
jgi:hypothetical protein